MKKLLLFIAIIFLSTNVIAQDELYLVFEFMKVDNDQENSYMETENFWEKIHQERIKNGDITGWDLWRLRPGGEDQGYQYLTVTLYSDVKKMLSGGGDLEAALKAAYPDMSDEKLNKTFNKTSKSRDLAVRDFLVEIDHTNDKFDMPLGTIAVMNFMKVNNGDFDKYEKAESEVFKPMHQKQVDSGRRGNWGLLKYILPRGSKAYATHIAVDMYKDYDQMLMAPLENTPKLTEAQQKKIQDGLATRDLKYVYMATLIKKAR